MHVAMPMEVPLSENKKFTKREELGDVPNFAFKSWREEFNREDVEKHLSEHGITEFVFDGIAGDGDLLLVTHKGPLTCIGKDELEKVLKAFSPVSYMLEPHGFEIMLTLVWNS